MRSFIQRRIEDKGTTVDKPQGEWWHYDDEEAHKSDSYDESLISISGKKRAKISREKRTEKSCLICNKPLSDDTLPYNDGGLVPCLEEKAVQLLGSKCNHACLATFKFDPFLCFWMKNSRAFLWKIWKILPLLIGFLWQTFKIVLIKQDDKYLGKHTYQSLDNAINL